jgi:tetratricopeptide (TPR) repeat protein
MLNVESLKLTGNRFFKEGDYSKSAEFYSQALDLLNTSNSEGFELSATLHSNRAASWLKLDLFDKCIDDCTAALALIPNDKKAYYRRALAFHKINENRKSLEDVKMLLYFDPNNVEGKKLFDIVIVAIGKEKKTSQISHIIDNIAKESTPLDNSLQQLISICDDNSSNILEFGREGGHIVIIQRLSVLLSSDTNESGLETAVLCLKLLSVLAKDERFVELFFKFAFIDCSIVGSSASNYSFVEDGKLTLDVLKLLFHDAQKIPLWTISSSKNIFQSLSKIKNYNFHDNHYISTIVQIFLRSLQSPNTITYGGLCELILVVSVGEAKERSNNNFLCTLQESKQICSLFIKHGMFDVLFGHLLSDVGLLRTQAMTLCGKIIKYFDRDDEIKLILSPMIENKLLEV